MADFLKQNWGNLASALGLVVSLGVLWVAQKAREAAQQARSLARLKSLLEQLESADNKTELVGVFLLDRDWKVVHFLIGEVLNACQSALARWGDYLTESKTSLLDACRVFESIADECVASLTGQLTEEEWQGTMRAQREARALISAVVGQVRKAEERSIQANA